MERTEMLPYQRVSSRQKIQYSSKKADVHYRFFRFRDVLINFIALMLGRAVIFSGMAPFGLAFYASSFAGSTKNIILAISIFIGLISSGMGITVFKYAVAMMLFIGFYIFNKNEYLQRPFFVAMIVYTSLIVSGIIPVIIQGFLLYDIFMVLFEAFIGFIMVFIFHTAMPVLKENAQRRMLSNEEMISLSILLGLVIIGIGDIHFFGGTSVRDILCILVILIFGLKNGVAVAASAGITIGLLNSIASPTMPIRIGSYAFCGLIAGVFKAFGKVGVSLGFILANAIFTIYVNGSTETLINIADILVAVAIFSVIPKKALDFVEEFLSKNAERFVDRKTYSRKIKNVLVNKLDNAAESFGYLATIFNNIAQKQTTLNTNDITVLFDQVADRVCKDCGLCLYCWEREFHNTYQIMFKILEKLEDKGRIEERDIPQIFQNRCMRIEDFVSAMNNAFEIYKLNLLWKNKVSESRSLVSQQLQGVAGIVSSLAHEITLDLQFDEEMEKTLVLELDKAGIRAQDVTVIQNSSGKHEIDVVFKQCGGSMKCLTKAAPVISRVVGRKMIKENAACSANKRESQCMATYIEAETYQVSTGIACTRKAGSTKCGDNYSFMQLKEGKYVLVLSDGMGSGDRAAKESTATIALLEQFLDSGFDKDTAVKLINSVLVLKSPDESFATIDLSIIDLHTGNVEFAKVGATSTFIKKPGKIEVIKSTSLPVGILDHIDMEISNKSVTDGDYIIMVTDGILETKNDIIRKDEWLKKLLMDINTTNPQEMADHILKAALENSNGSVNDDMTVLVSKVWKKIR